MAVNIPYSSALTEQSWRSGTILEAERRTFTSLFEGKGSEYAFPIEYRTGGSRGDTVTIRYTKYQDRNPKTAGDTIIGSEGSLNTVEDSLAMRYFAFDTAIHNVIQNQEMVSFDLKDREMVGMAVEWAYLHEKWVLNQLTGNTDANTADDYGLSGGNIVTAMDTNSIYFVDDSSGTNANATEVGADATAVLDTEAIDEVVKRAQSKNYRAWPIVPCRTPWGRHYVLVCNPDGYQQIRENSDNSAFYDLHKARIQGGESYDESVFVTGEGFIYDNTIVLKSDFAPTEPMGETNTARAAFFGAQAGCKLYGESFTNGDHIGWSEHIEHRRWSALTDSVCGFKRAIADGESFGAIAIVHHQPSLP